MYDNTYLVPLNDSTRKVCPKKNHSNMTANRNMMWLNETWLGTTHADTKKVTSITRYT